MQQDFTLTAYDYDLPKENIAQFPADQRDNSKLMVLNHQTGTRDHRRFSDICDLMAPGDLLVVNDTRVFPARLQGRKATGGKIEIFLLAFPAILTDQSAPDKLKQANAEALIKASKRPRPGDVVTLSEDLSCCVTELLEGGKARILLTFNGHRELSEILSDCGQVPLPPYIERTQGSTPVDQKRYQTVYADQPGAVAAPTAGLHFSEELVKKLAHQGVELAKITLHVGYGTFAPVRHEAIRDHQIHEEYIHISETTAQHINRVHREGGKVWAVGTTTVRALEFAADELGQVHETDGWCDLYIVPGFQFKVVNRLITNFHLPQSSLLFLVSAFCGREFLLDSYKEAIAQGYRFYSYGDAMVIID
ncbi:MAG: tRNA preQ1(34) S-adenosylmethionine ribosyltransferase-isomerase QueA [Desulfobulbaceae bacterium]|uniref:S-adenosylmethionine:tRNA ribosyltransferase-isomerase n=1 Tax=Candidatus Desulfatifera sulfidica TaxID=2841691 RepID=A0A8J6NCF3_9BACT|nr:tRNA preQ1(34) S-adenosylmethionine ribosyltransferase-isomerase QueA [Candidatus Desulfatifera sulfidica]